MLYPFTNDGLISFQHHGVLILALGKQNNEEHVLFKFRMKGREKWHLTDLHLSISTSPVLIGTAENNNNHNNNKLHLYSAFHSLHNKILNNKLHNLEKCLSAYHL